MADDKQEKEKCFYWLKLKKGFFKRHDIEVIEGMENGKDYVLFYLKLLCESLDHYGNLRFSDTIPYNEKMLSSVTHTNIDIVRSAMQILRELNLVEVLDDKTIYMCEVQKMIGSETVWAQKKREYRERQKQISGQCPNGVLPLSDKSIDLDLDTEEVSKKESIYINNKQTCVRAREDNYLGLVREDGSMKSYEELIADWNFEKEVESMIWGFIRHCTLNGRKMTNERLSSLLCDLADMDDDVERIKALQDAINGGWYDIRRNR